jgi:hypothetical protein
MTATMKKRAQTISVDGGMVEVDVGDIDIPLSDVLEALGQLPSDVDNQIQSVFDRLGPQRDRYTDWRKCMEEPWLSLSGAIR